MTKTKTGEALDATALLATWEAELAEIDARRAELVVGIGMLRRSLGLSDEAPTEVGPRHRSITAPPKTMDEGARRPYLGKNILEAARLYLAKAQEPKTPSDIAEAIKDGGVHSKSPNFAGVVRTTLSRKGRGAGIESFGNTRWGLSVWRPGRAKTSTQQDEGGGGEG